MLGGPGMYNMQGCERGSSNLGGTGVLEWVGCRHPLY